MTMKSFLISRTKRILGEFKKDWKMCTVVIIGSIIFNAIIQAGIYFLLNAVGVFNIPGLFYYYLVVLALGFIIAPVVSIIKYHNFMELERYRRILGKDLF